MLRGDVWQQSISIYSSVRGWPTFDFFVAPNAPQYTRWAVPGQIKVGGLRHGE